MATPYEFVAQQLCTRLPGARVAPLRDQNYTSRYEADARLYKDAPADDYTRLVLRYPGGYPFYYPLQLTVPGGQRPLRVRIAPGADYLHRFTRPDADVRTYLAHYGYWRIEERVDPETTDFWILMLGLEGEGYQYLILPTNLLQRLLSQSHDPEKYSLFISKAGRCFAAQPLSTARRLAVLKDPALLDAPENQGLEMGHYLNNWQQLQ